MNDFPWLPLIIILLPVVGILLLTSWRSNQLLERWAARNDLKILEKQHRWLRTGPYLWRKSRSQTVFRVVVRDAQGMKQTGWVRLGSWLMGVASDTVDVTWEDAP